MLRLIALFLFSLGLALPAIAAPLCHEAALPAASEAVHHAAMKHGAEQSAMPHHAAAPDSRGKDTPSPASRHECIGCVARFALPTLVSPAPLPPTAIAPVRLPALQGIAITPALPPPRS